MAMPRFLAALAAVLVAFAASAASVVERSPFTQGHWWDPGRAGHGFDIFNSGGQVAVMWFTYDENSRPVWYTAQGDDTTLGQQAWPLLKHRWADGHKAGYTQVGTLRLDVNHPESMKVTWQIGTHTGAWDIQPFRVSGVMDEIDHTGSWFDPSNSGWGIAIVEQGDVLGGAVFTYDANGEPLWLAGFDRNPSTVQLYTAIGTCPWCTYQPSKLTSGGKLTFAFRDESHLVLTNSLAAPIAAGVNMDGARLVQLGRPASLRPADRQLASFDSDGPLRTYLVAGMLNLPPRGGGADFSAAPPSTPFSTTNLQESGVDEPDMVKSDGAFVYTFDATANGMPAPTLRIARVGEDVSSLQVVASVPLSTGAATPMGNAGLMLDGTDLIAITGSQASGFGVTAWASSSNWIDGTTNVEIFDVSSASTPRSAWRAQLDGYLLAARRIGERLYLVTRFAPKVDGFVYGAAPSGSLAQSNRQLLANVPTSALLPQVRINGGSASPLVSPARIHAPPQGARPPMADMVVVSAIDLTSRRIAQALAMVGAADAVYVSPANLFLASSRYVLRTTAGVPLPQPPFYMTDLHQVRLAADAMSIVGSGSVEGFLGTDADQAPFRLSEYQGKLRVVSGSLSMWGAASSNRLTILEPSAIAPGVLRTVSVLPNAAHPESLGKPGELLYSTRFVGDRLYAVTFKKVDPLYVVDLVNAADPHITGTLEIPGFSEYLHPLPNGLLLGFGKDTVPSSSAGDGQFAWYQGLMLSLYDVSNAGAPKELQRVVMGKRGSDSALLRSHHAFSALLNADGTGQVAMPVSLHDGPTPQFGTGDSAFYPWTQSGLMRFEIRGTSAADSRLVALQPLITHAAPSVAPPLVDAAIYSARSVLFPKGVVYVGNGHFWRQDASGAVSGPY